MCEVSKLITRSKQPTNIVNIQLQGIAWRNYIVNITSSYPGNLVNIQGQSKHPGYQVNT